MKSLLPLLTLLIVFSLSSCEDMFKYNLFSGVDERDYSNPEDMSVDELLVAINDENFFDQLNDADPEQIEALLAMLDEQATDLSDPDGAMEAAMIQSLVILETTGAMGIMDNVNDLLINSLTGDDSSDSGSDDLLASLITTDDPDVLASQIDGLLAVSDALGNYGAALEAGGDAPSTVDNDSLGSQALISGMVQNLADPDGDGVEDNSTEEMVDYLLNDNSDGLTSPPEDMTLFDDGGDGDLTGEDMEANVIDVYGEDLGGVILDSSIGDLLVSGVMEDAFGSEGSEG